MVENPSAFPIVVPIDFRAAEYGMTLRDWYKGQALVGILANPVSFGPIMQGDPNVIAAACCTFADALLAARQKGGDS